jgi:hypothetical protein
MCGKYFGIRGGEELRNVRKNCLSFIRKENEEMNVTYNESLSKCVQVQRGLSKTNAAKVTSHTDIDVKARYSFTSVSYKYNSKLPKDSDKLVAMWFRAKTNVDGDEALHFSIPKNTLATSIKNMMTEVGFKSGYTNHSLGVSVTTVNTLSTG